jgi:hypothetical protein
MGEGLSKEGPSLRFNQLNFSITYKLTRIAGNAYIHN